MKPPPDIVAIGHIVRETIVFPDRATDQVLGGPAAYSSLALARLGGSVGLVSCVGADMPAQLLAPFPEAGVDLAGLNISPDEVTSSTRLVYDRAGNKKIVYAAKARALTLEDVPAAYRKAGIFSVCAMDHDVESEEISRIAALGRPVAVDLGGYGGAHTKPGVRPAGLSPEWSALARQVDLVKASDEDCRRIMADPNVSDEAFGRRMLEWGIKIFVATRGARGAIVLTDRDRFVIPPFGGPVIDTTGGGDVFWGGFLLAYFRTGDPEYAGRFGAATASEMIGKTGGAWAGRMPTATMLAERLLRPMEIPVGLGDTG